MFKKILLMACVVVLAGCHSGPQLPPVNLSAPGWTSARGQAVWRPNGDAQEIAGDLLLATRSDGSAFVQFSKNPFPLITAQRTPASWEVQVPTRNRRFSGRGHPPARLFWLYLPDLLQGGPAPNSWSWTRLGTNRWRLENRRTGEFLEGIMF